MYQGQPVPTTTHQQARAKVSDGKSVRVVVPKNTDTIKAAELVEIGGFLGFAMRTVEKDAERDQELILNIEQAEYETDQIEVEDTLAAGTKVYWNPTDKVLTEEADDGDAEEPTAYRPAGRITVGKDANNVVWFILGPQV